MTLDGQKVVIVGGSSGIGLGVARAALARNAHVVIAGRSQSRLDEATNAMERPARLKAIQADATREGDIVRLFGEAGSFDHLVVTGGVAMPAPIESMDLRAACAFVENKLIAALALAKHAHGHLRKGGSLTFSSGISKDRPGPGGAVVAAVASSFGGLARALALEMAPTRVNVVSPGWVDTPVWDALVGPAKTDVLEQTARRLPVGRIAKPEDIAPAYLFLMESEFTTGTTVHVDGGHALV